MKSYLCLFLCCLFLSTSITAQDDETPIKKDRSLKNGFSLHFELGFPGAAYGIDDNINNLFDFNSGVLFGLQIGNRWYFERQEKFAIGIMVNWFDASIAANAQSSRSAGTPEVAKATIDFSFIEVGPVGSYKIKEDMALDGYYNLRPTLISSVIVDEDGSGFASVGVGITHAIGFAFRYKVFYVGPEFVIGKIKGVDVRDAEDFNEVFYESNLNVNNFRILMGFKF